MKFERESYDDLKRVSPCCFIEKQQGLQRGKDKRWIYLKSANIRKMLMRQ